MADRGFHIQAITSSFLKFRSTSRCMDKESDDKKRYKKQKKLKIHKFMLWERLIEENIIKFLK